MKKVTLDVRYLLQLDLTGVRLRYCNEPLHKFVSLPKVLLVAVIPDKVVLHLLDFHLGRLLSRACVEDTPRQSLHYRRRRQGVRCGGQGFGPKCHDNAKEKVVARRFEVEEVKEKVANALKIVEEAAAQDKHPPQVLHGIDPGY